MDEESHDILLEFVRVGNQLKVTACDSETGAEAVVFGPVSAGKRELRDLAVRKLRYVLRKRREGAETPDPDDSGFSA